METIAKYIKIIAKVLAKGKDNKPIRKIVPKSSKWAFFLYKEIYFLIEIIELDILELINDTSFQPVNIKYTEP